MVDWSKIPYGDFGDLGVNRIRHSKSMRRSSPNYDQPEFLNRHITPNAGKYKGAVPALVYKTRQSGYDRTNDRHATHSPQTAEAEYRHYIYNVYFHGGSCYGSPPSLSDGAIIRNLPEATLDAHAISSISTFGRATNNYDLTSRLVFIVFDIPGADQRPRIVRVGGYVDVAMFQTLLNETFIGGTMGGGGGGGTQGTQGTGGVVVYDDDCPEDSTLPSVKSTTKFSYSELLQMKPALSTLLSWISSHEGKKNSVNRGSSGDSPGGSVPYIGAKLTSISISKVMSYQKGGSRAGEVKKYSEKPGKGRRWSGGETTDDNEMYHGDGLYAVGKIQYIPGTLKSTVKETGVDKNLLFTAEVQDNLALRLMIGLKRRKLAGYLLGLHDNVIVAGQEMALEWASIPLQYARDNGCQRGFSAWCKGGANSTTRLSRSPCEVIVELKAARRRLLTDPASVQIMASKGIPTGTTG